MQEYQYSANADGEGVLWCTVEVLVMWVVPRMSTMHRELPGPMRLNTYGRTLGMPRKLDVNKMGWALERRQPPTFGHAIHAAVELRNQQEMDALEDGYPRVLQVPAEEVFCDAHRYITHKDDEYEQRCIMPPDHNGGHDWDDMPDEVPRTLPKSFLEDDRYY